MININELRIGNYIQDGKVEQINNGIDEVYYSGDGYYQSDYCCNLNPIPLTEEWLFKFKYFKIEHKECNFVVKGHTIWICNNMYLCEKNGIILKHVHQLQNLYFALTNKEL